MGAIADAADLHIAQRLWREMAADLAHDDAKARMRLVSRVQIALRESRRQVCGVELERELFGSTEMND